MTVIRLAEPRPSEHGASFSWSVEPESELYRQHTFEISFPSSVETSRVPLALWWRLALACLHTQWPLLRPCRVVLPVRLPPGEREFWARLCDAQVATLEAHAGGRDLERRVEIVESGPPVDAPAPPPGPADPDLVTACFSGGRDSLTQTALLQELGLKPLLVTVNAPQPATREYETTQHAHVMQEICARRGVELVQASSTLRGCWDTRFAWERYGVAVSELADTFLYAMAAVVVAWSRGSRAVYLASESELQESAQIGGRIVQHKHFMYSAATQRAVSAMLEPFGIRYGGLTYPLWQFQVQRLLGQRYRDLADLQYSCWSMTGDERACSRCGECRINAFNVMAEGRAPAEIGIDLVPLLRAHADWVPRHEARASVLPNGRWRSDMQMVRCLEAVTPEVARAFIDVNGGLSADALDSLEQYASMRERALEFELEPEPGWRPGFLSLIDPNIAPRLAAIFDEHCAREPIDAHADVVARSVALSDWITAPLSRPELDWRPVRRVVAPLRERPMLVAPPAAASYDAADFESIRELVPDPEPPLVRNQQTLSVATTSLDGNELSYVSDAVRRNWVSSAGSFVGEFEHAFAAAAGCRYGVACSSGTTALHLAVAAAGIEPGDEVILPTFTMIASPNAVGYVGATPVLVDSDPSTWNLDLDGVRDAIGPRTRAIMIVHTYGHPVDADAVRALADANGLAVIEDAAEAHGAEHLGRRAGSLGTVGAFSFYGNKIVTTGEGGMVTTNDERIAAVARELRDHGFSTERHFWHRYRAFNFRMGNLQAAVGLAQVERLEELLARRRHTAALYREALASIPGLELPPSAEGYDDACWMFGIVVGDEFGLSRDELRRRLAADGIETRTFFVPIHIQPAYRAAWKGRRFPVAERLGRLGLYLPSGPDIGEVEVARVAAAIESHRRPPSGDGY